jgi:hypothetical protein
VNKQQKRGKFMIRGKNLPSTISSRLKQIKKGMIKRCYNKNCTRYKRYGGRGLIVCDEWLNDREAFYKWALHYGYQENLTLDRIDNNQGYSPKNCRWATYDEQMQNSIKAKLTAETVLKIRSEYPTLSYSKLSLKYDVNKSTISCIIKRKTWRNI